DLGRYRPDGRARRQGPGPRAADLPAPASRGGRERHRTVPDHHPDRAPRGGRVMRIVADAPLSPAELHRLDAYWRAANYLSAGQIYLLDNPLLREPLRPEHIKPRLLGHWGTTPGLNFLYAHLSRIVATRDRDLLYVTG